MRFAYADPPYLGCAERLYGHLHPEAADYDNVETHHALIDRLVADFPDGWALSCGSKDLQVLLPRCPTDVRVAAWVKTWTALVLPVKYAWEPVIFRGGHKGQFGNVRARDWLQSAPAMRGFTGAKPDEFSFWLFDIFGATKDDEFVDLFPGSGSVTRAWQAWRDMDRMWHKALSPTQPAESLFKEHQTDA